MNKTTTVVTNIADCCTPPETIAEEIYCGTEEKILLSNCCDPSNGCMQYDVRKRCDYWPRFAHPRWLNCHELYDKDLDS